MSTRTLSHNDGTIEVACARALDPARRRRTMTLTLAAALLIGAVGAYLGENSPGPLLRRELARAGEKVGDLPWSTPLDQVQEAVSQQFPGFRASVDASAFPAYVTVTLHDLDRADCRAARRVADRIEGKVVVAMERPQESSCEERTSISWRIMP